MGVLGPPATVEDSRRLGRAAVMAMLAVARCSPGGVLDSTFYPYTVPHLEQLPGTLIEVRCRCPREIAKARYEARSAGRIIHWKTAARKASRLAKRVKALKKI